MKKLILAAVYFLFCVTAAGCAGPIVEPKGGPLVEIALLPATIIEGEPGYDLGDRMTLHGVPGVSIAVIEGAEIQWVRHYGLKDLDTRRPVTDSTLFQLNAALRPESANVFDSLGEALMKTGRTDEAVASYRRSLELDPGNTNAEKKIAELTGVS